MKDFFPRKFGPKTWVHSIGGSTLYTAKYGHSSEVAGGGMPCILPRGKLLGIRDPKETLPCGSSLCLVSLLQSP